MFHNYQKTAFRFLKHNKIFAGINALGLSIALAATFIILLFVINELSYNHCHKNRERIFRLLIYSPSFNNIEARTEYFMAGRLKEEFPQIEKAIRVKNIYSFKLKLGNGYINVPDAVATDSEIFDIFTLPLVGGAPPKNLLDDQNSIVLSRELAEKFFQGKDPVGKEIIALVNNEEHVFIIKRVFESIPVNSTLQAQCFINSKWTIEPVNKVFGITVTETGWSPALWITWVLLSKNCNAELFEKQFLDIQKKIINEKSDGIYSLQNLSDVYLGSDKIDGTGRDNIIRGNIKNIRLFSSIALLIVLVAAFNYIILSTAVSSGRTKEIGIRKSFGAGNNDVKNQLLGESILLSTLILPVALLLMWLALPYAGKLFQTQLQIISSNIIIYIIVYLVLTIIIGISSGVCTSAYLSRLKVMDILNRTIYSGKRKSFFRSILILVQLFIFCSFVSSTLIIRSQYQYALKKDIGFINKNILLVDLGRDFKGYSGYINSIKSNPNIIMAAGTMEGLPMLNSGSFLVPHFQDKEQNVEVEGMSIDYNFLKTMGITFLKGRDFSEEFGSDLTSSAILNETAVKKLGITDPIGKIIENKTIIGVVKDFNLHSIRSDIPPLLIDMTDKYIEQVAIHYKPGKLDKILPFVKAEWKKVAPDRPFKYSTIEEIKKDTYSSEKNLGTIITIFALFTLLIAALGLFGLTLFMTKTRTKEIGIKKAFGSSENSIIYSFLQTNFILVLISALFSVPVTLHFMTKWLKNFSYKINISWWVFAIAFIVATVVVLLTVFIHSYKASRINPVEALRYE